MTDAAPNAPIRGQSPYPARSKMLDMYAADIAGMLTEKQYENAERHALAIPHIAVALADAALQSSCASYRDWCVRWVQPSFEAAAYDGWWARSGECERGVPFVALRTLRLQRRARETLARFTQSERVASSSNSQTITRALLGAVCRWYEQEGRYQPSVQTNLARLGVLR
jgi:hypothetical protein